ncbi:MAG: sodium:proline symporter, partial [Lentisphaeria bacterium]|nr:sodium:proline symporter [Lentisphaeria bacterium]
FTYAGALAGIIVGFMVDAVWYIFALNATNIYEIVPGFVAGLIASVVVSLCSKKPDEKVIELFNQARNIK